MDIFLVGVDHRIQYQAKYAKLFTKYLEDEIKNKNVDLVAEEFSVQALQRYSISQTHGQILCKNLKINHLFVDPDLNERKVLGIKLREDVAKEIGFITGIYDTSEENKINNAMRYYDDLREKEWLRRIKIVSPERVIFICGYEHIATISKLLEGDGASVEFLREFKDDRDGSKID